MQSTEQTDVREALNERGGFHAWWRLLRPHTLTASFVPVFVGTMYASFTNSIDWILFAAMMVASLLIQSATNMFNEYYDFVRGLDTQDSVGISGSIVRDGMKPKTILNSALIFFGLALLLGVYISASSSWWIAIIGLICMAFGYLYTGGPLPIAYTPLGEVFSGILMGSVIIGISFFIQTGVVTWDVVLISLPVTILIGSLNLSNNIRDREGDKIGGRKTLAILLGHERAITLMAAAFIVAYGLTILYIVIGLLPIESLITLISAVKAREVIKGFRGKTTPLQMMPAMIATGKTNTFYGLLLSVSLLIHTILS